LDLPAFLLAADADSEVHLSYLPGLLTLLTTSGRYVEEWVRVFYASVWINPDHQWMRFRFEREDVTIHDSLIRQLFGFNESSTRLHSLCYGSSDSPLRPHGGVAPGTAQVAALFRPPFSDGSQRSPADFTTAAKFLYQLMRRTLLPRMVTRRLPLISSSGCLVPWSLTQSLMLWTSLFVRSRTLYWMVYVPDVSCHMLTISATSSLS
jgi:hypothetical protein